MTLDELRGEIDGIDEAIVRMLNERAEKALLAGEEKKKDGLSVFDEDRERRVLERIAGLNCGPLSDEVFDGIYRRLMDACTDIQNLAG